MRTADGRGDTAGDTADLPMNVDVFLPTNPPVWTKAPDLTTDMILIVTSKGRGFPDL